MMLVSTAGLACLAGPAVGGPILDSTAGTNVTAAHCLDILSQTVGGQATHLEFISRAGTATFEFIVSGDDGSTYYVGCNGELGTIQYVNVIVSADDERFASRAQIDEAQARQTATAQYPGGVEEVKAVLTSDGQALYEVDVEAEEDAAAGEAGFGTGTGEFNVYVDAENNRIAQVDVEYWEIGEGGDEADEGGEN